MVEKYKREGIDIVLGSRKCIYTDEKNKKFIKQNKKYIPIIKIKGKYVIINRKGGGLDIDELKITLEKLIGELNDKIKESTGKVNDKLKKIKQELTVVLTVNETLDYNKLNNIIEDYTFKIGIVLGLESSKIKKDITFLNKSIKSNNAIIDKVNYESTTKTSYVDEDKIRRITSENNNMLLSIDEKVEQYDKQVLLEKEGNVKGKLHDDIPENKTHNTIEDKKSIEQMRLKTDIETQDKIKEKIHDDIPENKTHNTIEDEIEKNKLNTDIETHKNNMKQFVIELRKNTENIKLLSIELKKPKKSGFFSDNSQHYTNKQNLIKLMQEKPKILFNFSRESQIVKEKNKILKEKSKILKELEKNEEWDKKSPNLEKKQFLKEITEKEELIKSLQENHTEYKKKMDREEIYLDIYLKEKNNDIDLYFIDKGNYPFLVELLLKRIIDLEKRIDVTYN